MLMRIFQFDALFYTAASRFETDCILHFLRLNACNSSSLIHRMLILKVGNPQAPFNFTTVMHPKYRATIKSQHLILITSRGPRGAF